MITYELAKQLKDAGFPQNNDQLYAAEDFKDMSIRDVVNTLSRIKGQHRTFDYSIYPEPIPDDWSQGKARNSYYFSREYLESDEGHKYTVYFPILSELIGECGNRFDSLIKDTELAGDKIIKDSWTASCLLEEPDILQTTSGYTPEEAVARLYIALNMR